MSGRSLTVIFFMLLPLFSAAQIITTIAGSGTQGYCGDGGPALQACFNGPNQVAIDNQGNIYFSETINNIVRKLSVGGIITTFAGNGASGFSGDGNEAKLANLDKPEGIAFDSAGNLFIGDANNHRIRKVDKNGIITTAYGTGVMGYSGDNGPASTAQLIYPNAIFFDPQWNLIICDNGSSVLRKVAHNTGIITTIAGTGQPGYGGDDSAALNARFFNAAFGYCNKKGEIFIADNGNYRVRKIGLNGIISTYAGNGTPGSSGDGGPATQASIVGIGGFATDYRDNSLYIGDAADGRIRRIDSNGIITTICGDGQYVHSGDNGPAINAEIYAPSGLIFDSLYRLVIAETGGNTIRRITFPPTGINNTVRNLIHLKACPNPVVSGLYVEWQQSTGTSVIKIINALGQAILRQPVEPSKTSAVINMQNFASGIYNVLLICDGTIQDAVTIQKQ